MEFRHLEAAGLVPECECKHGREEWGPLLPTVCGQWARPTDPKTRKSSSWRSGCAKSWSPRWPVPVTPEQRRSRMDLGPWVLPFWAPSRRGFVLRNCPAENQPHGRQEVPPAHSFPCSPCLESLQKLLGADSGWRLRLQVGCHPVPDCPGVQGDRQ